MSGISRQDEVNRNYSRSALPDGQIDVWSADLDTSPVREQDALALLSADECDRADRFGLQVDRTRFILRRGILRTLLGGYLFEDPKMISLSYLTHGKPALASGKIHFSVSHSGSYVCFAFHASSPIGLDLERVRPIPDIMRVAGYFCSDAELAVLMSLSAEQNARAFLRFWTVKEASVKALGLGLHYPMKHISASAGGHICFPSVSPSRGIFTDWHIHSWDPPTEYVGSLVSRSANNKITSHKFSGS